MIAYILEAAFASSQPQRVLTVDLAFGGIVGAARVLQARHGVPIDVEEPALQPVDLVVLPGANDTLLLHRAHDELRFDYPAEGGVDAGLEALVAAWTALGGPGSPYRIRRVGEVRQLIPTTTRTDAGAVVAWSSPLDCPLTLEAQQGDPLAPAQSFLAAWLGALEAQCGVGFVNDLGLGALPPPEQPPSPEFSAFLDRCRVVGEEACARELPVAPNPELPAFRGPARDRLDAIARWAGLGGYRLYAYVDELPTRSGWILDLVEVMPADESVGNRTPLAGPRSEVHGRPRPTPPIPWQTWVDWRRRRAENERDPGP